MQFEQFDAQLSDFPWMISLGYPVSYEFRPSDSKMIIHQVERIVTNSTGFWAWSFLGSLSQLGFRKLHSFLVHDSDSLDILLPGTVKTYEDGWKFMEISILSKDILYICSALRSAGEYFYDFQFVGWELTSEPNDKENFLEIPKFLDGKLQGGVSVKNVIVSTYDWDSLQVFCRTADEAHFLT